MKKALLLTALSLGISGSAIADDVFGLTPEDAKPLPMMLMLMSADQAADEMWFTYTCPATQNGRPGMFPTAVLEDGRHMLYIYKCADGTFEAPQRTPGSDSYILEPGESYLVKVLRPTSYPFMPMLGMPHELPASMEGQEYFPKKMSETRVEVQGPGTTVWYDTELPITTMIGAGVYDVGEYGFTPHPDITSIVVKHQECPGGVNEGTPNFPAYNKAGRNIIGITVAENLTRPSTVYGEDKIQFALTLNGAQTINCTNKLHQTTVLKESSLNKELTYPDAYWTVDKVFEAPEDGNYTFINHGAPGTELNIGSIIVTPDEYLPVTGAWACDFSNGETAVCGTDDAEIVKTMAKGERVVVQSNAFQKLGAPTYLKIVKGGQTSIDDIEAADKGLKVTVSGGAMTISSVLLAAGADVAVYDMNARKVAGVKVAAGAESQVVALDVPAGVYMVVVYGKNQSDTAKVIVK